MRIRSLRRLAVVAAIPAVVAVVVFAVGSALAQPDVQHGIGFTKGCPSPTFVGARLSCSYTVRNVIDEAEDTMTVTGIADTVLAAGGAVASPPGYLGQSSVTVSAGATCVAASGNGTAGNPY